MHEQTSKSRVQRRTRPARNSQTTYQSIYPPGLLPPPPPSLSSLTHTYTHTYTHKPRTRAPSPAPRSQTWAPEPPPADPSLAVTYPSRSLESDISVAPSNRFGCGQLFLDRFGGGLPNKGGMSEPCWQRQAAECRRSPVRTRSERKRRFNYTHTLLGARPCCLPS